MEKQNFYFQGKYFETSEEMFEYANKWSDFPLDEEMAEKILNGLTKDIVMNVFLHGQPFSNDEFIKYVQRIFEFSMRTLNENNKNGIKNDYFSVYCWSYYFALARKKYLLLILEIIKLLVEENYFLQQ